MFLVFNYIIRLEVDTFIDVFKIFDNICMLITACYLKKKKIPIDSDMPDHDLEPPRFAQLALERVLQDWNALKSMIMFGSQESKDP